MDISIILGFMGISLAIFTIGLPNIPSNILAKILFGKKQEPIVIETFLAIMGVCGFYGFTILFGYLIANLAAPLASLLAPSTSHVKVALVQLAFGIIAALLFYVFVIWAYKTAINIGRKRSTKQLASKIEKRPEVPLPTTENLNQLAENIEAYRKEKVDLDKFFQDLSDKNDRKNE